MTGTLGREVISTRQRKIAELAQREPKLTLTTLAHHIDDVWMSFPRHGAIPLDETPEAFQMAGMAGLRLARHLRGTEEYSRAPHPGIESGLGGAS